MKKNSGKFGWVPLAALIFSVALGGHAFGDSPQKGECLMTVGAVPYHFNPYETPDGAQNFTCDFSKEESCFTFVPDDEPNKVEYGCGKIDGYALPRSCGKASSEPFKNRCQQRALHNGLTGKLCCCVGESCNTPEKSYEVLPTSTTTSTTSTTTTTTPAPVALASKEDLVSNAVHVPQSNWWQTPLIIFVVLTFLAMCAIVAVIVHVMSKLKTYRNQQADLANDIEQRLEQHAQKVAEEARQQTAHNFRVLVKHYQNAVQAQRQKMIQKQLQSGTNTDLSSKTDHSSEQTQKSLAESDTGGQSGGRILGCLPRNPCSSTKSSKAPSGRANSEISLAKLPRVEHV